MTDSTVRQALALMLILLGFNTLAVAFLVGYSFSVHDQLTHLENLYEPTKPHRPAAK